MTQLAETPYKHTKQELLKRLNIMDDAKTRSLLEDQVLGDQMPSEFPRLLRMMWTGRLPTAMQSLLMTRADEPLDRTAKLADDVMQIHWSASVASQPQIAVVAPSTNSGIKALTLQIAHLMAVVQALIAGAQNKHRSRPRDRGRSASRGQSSSHGRAGNPDHCRYHQKFGGDVTDDDL